MKSVETLSIVAMSLFSLLGLFLLSKERMQEKGFVWLGIFFLLLAVNYLDGALMLSGALLKFPRLAFWEDPFALLYGPFIYFFSLRIRHGVQQKWNYLWLHFLPFLLLEAGIAFYHFTTPLPQIRDVMTLLISQQGNPMMLLGMIPVFVHVLGYLFWARHTLNNHRADLKKYYSSIEISWAFSLVNMVLVIFLVSLLSTLMQHLGSRGVWAVVLLILILLSIFLTLRILLFALNKPVFHAETKVEPSFSLPPEEATEIHRRILSTLEEKKLFTNPKLTLKELAVELGVSERAVSYVINHSMARNFYDFVNEYRIQEAQSIFEKNTDPKLTVLEVLYDVGFNSKSSFNTQFKKKTGMTPTEYKRLRGNFSK